MVTAALRGAYPGTINEGRFMAQMLRMSAFQVGDPVGIFVLMKVNDSSFHACELRLPVWIDCILSKARSPVPR